MGAAIRRRHGVTVGGQKTVGIGGPGERPFAGTVGAVTARFSPEDVRMHQRIGMDGGCEVILQAARKMETVLSGDVLDTLEQSGIAMPADFNAAEQVGLGTGHLEQAL